MSYDCFNWIIRNNEVNVSHIFHIALLKLQEFYFSYYGLPEMTTSKIPKMIRDDKYRNILRKRNPDDEFIRLYFECLNEQKTIKERLPILVELLKHSTKDIDYNNNDYRVVLSKIKTSNQLFH